MEEVELNVQGTAVYGQWHGGKVRRAAIVLHGYNSDLREHGTLPAYLAAHGIGALAIDMRGHGRSQGERGKVDLERALEDVDAAVAWVRDRIGRKPLGLIGHSLGGALALGIAARRDHFEALVVAHPVNRLVDELGPVERRFFHLVATASRRRRRHGKASLRLPRPPSYRDGFVDKALARQAKEEGYLQDKAFIGNYTFASTMDASTWAARAKVPVLAIRSDHDKTVKPEHSAAVIEAIADVQVVDHAGGHVCFRDLDRGRVLDAVATFLEAKL